MSRAKTSIDIKILSLVYKLQKYNYNIGVFKYVFFWSTKSAVDFCNVSICDVCIHIAESTTQID